MIYTIKKEGLFQNKVNPTLVVDSRKSSGMWRDHFVTKIGNIDLTNLWRSYQNSAE